MNKPFLKWVGGKTRVAERIKAVLPPGKRLVEPFVGSGAIFLNTDYDEYSLSDSNEVIIDLFKTVSDSKDKSFINICESLFSDENNDKEQYALLRETYNETNDTLVKSSIFVYLNRFGFNGICRYNSKGAFNVPFRGTKYGMPYFPKKEMINFWNKCQSKSVEFNHYDFREAFEQVKDGDVVYCDPPYMPLSDTSSFTSYDTEGFTQKDQEDLAKLATDARVPVIISNHDVPLARSLYNKAIFIENFEVGRFVGGIKGSRKKATEILAVFNSDYGKNKTLWDK